MRAAKHRPFCRGVLAEKTIEFEGGIGRFFAKVDHYPCSYVSDQEVARKMPDLTINEPSAPVSETWALIVGSGGTAGNPAIFSGIWSVIPLDVGETPAMRLEGTHRHPGSRGPGCLLPGAHP
jgi:hypothetical protein